MADLDGIWGSWLLPGPNLDVGAICGKIHEWKISLYHSSFHINKISKKNTYCIMLLLFEGSSRKVCDETHSQTVTCWSPCLTSAQEQSWLALGGVLKLFVVVLKLLIGTPREVSQSPLPPLQPPIPWRFRDREGPILGGHLQPNLIHPKAGGNSPTILHVTFLLSDAQWGCKFVHFCACGSLGGTSERVYQAGFRSSPPIDLKYWHRDSQLFLIW